MSVPAERRRQSLRGSLAFLAVSAAVPGLWATFAPGAFYASFPFGGDGWVRPLGPASPHFTADVGAFYLAFAALFVWAAWKPDQALVMPISAAWMLFSALHLRWHAANLEPLSEGAAAEQTVSLALVLGLPALVIWLARSAPHETPAPPPSVA